MTTMKSVQTGAPGTIEVVDVERCRAPGSRPAGCAGSGAAHSRSPGIQSSLRKLSILSVCLAPPAGAVVLSFDEKTQVQALSKDPADAPARLEGVVSGIRSSCPARPDVAAVPVRLPAIDSLVALCDRQTTALVYTDSGLRRQLLVYPDRQPGRLRWHVNVDDPQLGSTGTAWFSTRYAPSRPPALAGEPAVLDTRPSQGYCRGYDWPVGNGPVDPVLVQDAGVVRT